MCHTGRRDELPSPGGLSGMRPVGGSKGSGRGPVHWRSELSRFDDNTISRIADQFLHGF